MGVVGLWDVSLVMAILILMLTFSQVLKENNIGITVPFKDFVLNEYLKNAKSGNPYRPYRVGIDARYTVVSINGHAGSNSSQPYS
jgi:hypothetical protein